MSPRTVKLKQLLESVNVLASHGDLTVTIESVTMDSRQVEPACLFIAIEGQKVDGHDFIAEAVNKGASAIVCARSPGDDTPVPWVIVDDTKKSMATIASEFYGRPSSELQLVGITGTNGKTTLTYLMESIARAAGMNPGVIGTVEVRYSGKTESTPHTTPQALDLQSLLRKMVDQGVDVVFMEVSSHGLELGRVFACDFDVGVFTNLTRDHLDFHGGMKQYARAKALLFERELNNSKASQKVAVANGDDPMYKEVTSGFDGKSILFGLNPDWDVHPSGILKSDLDGIAATIESPAGPVEVRSRMVGRHNLENLCAAVAVSCALGLEPGAMSEGISNCPVVPGRLEPVDSPAGFPAVFVDYAHTDDALSNVLAALAPLSQGRLIVVFGCGGDRDRGKRPLMGKAVARGADLAVVTSDNPRTEDPMGIIHEILPGLRTEGWNEANAEEFGSGSRSFAVVQDRRDAIALALKAADERDLVLIAGKGHETYQLVGDQVLEFDDRVVAAELMTENQLEPSLQ